MFNNTTNVVALQVCTPYTPVRAYIESLWKALSKIFSFISTKFIFNSFFIALIVVFQLPSPN